MKNSTLTPGQTNVLTELHDGGRTSGTGLNNAIGGKHAATSAASLVRSGHARKLKNGDYQITASGRRASEAATVASESAAHVSSQF